MIVSPDQKLVLSNLGWVDHGAVWRYNHATDSAEEVVVGDARHLVLHAGVGGLFLAVHHFDGSQLVITVQTFDRPAEAVASMTVSGWAPRMEGDPAAWTAVPQRHVGWLNEDATGAAGYFLVSVGANGAAIARLDWFDADSYDLGYQSVTSVATVPHTGELLFGVQRAGHLVLAEPTGDRIQVIQLAERHGNPVPHLRVGIHDAWATTTTRSSVSTARPGTSPEQCAFKRPPTVPRCSSVTSGCPRRRTWSSCRDLGRGTLPSSTPQTSTCCRGSKLVASRSWP